MDTITRRSWILLAFKAGRFELKFWKLLNQSCRFRGCLPQGSPMDFKFWKCWTIRAHSWELSYLPLLLGIWTYLEVSGEGKGPPGDSGSEAVSQYHLGILTGGKDRVMGSCCTSGSNIAGRSTIWSELRSNPALEADMTMTWCHVTSFSFSSSAAHGRRYTYRPVCTALLPF